MTLRDVADAAGVHPSTVSRVLTERTRRLVNDDTAARVEAMVRELGYEPNPIARGLKTKRSMTIGVLINDLTNPLFPPIVRGIEARLLDAGYTALVSNTDAVPERQRRSYDSMLARQVDGFIFATARRQDDVVDRAMASGVPFALVARSIDDGGVPAVVPDDARGVELVIEHLLALGHRRIAHLAGPQDVSNGLRRLRAYEAVVREAGLRPDVVSGAAFTIAEGERRAAALLDAAPDLTAIVAANDLMAVGAIGALTAAGRRCPDDVSVTGFNDMPLADRLSPPLTTVQVHHYEMGVRAAELLLDRLGEPEAPAAEVLIAPRLVVRGSTGHPRGGR